MCIGGIQSAKAQHIFIDSLSFGHRASTGLSVNAFDTPGPFALLNIGINILLYNKTTGEVESNPHFFGSSFQAESGPLFLLRNPDGLYAFGPLGLTLVHSLGGSNNFPHHYRHASDSLYAYFRYRDKELWLSDGSTSGTELWRNFDEEIVFLHSIGDTLHCITGGDAHLHYAIHKGDSGVVVHPMPGTIASQRVFKGDKLELRGYGSDLHHPHWLFYQLKTRVLTEVHNDDSPKISASSMKLRDGWYYASSWFRGNHRTRMDIGHIRRFNFEEGSSELMVETDSVYQGILEVFPLESGKNVVLGSISPLSGAEVYGLEPEFGLEQLKEIYPGRSGSLLYNLGSSGLSVLKYKQAIEHEGHLYFTANSPEQGAEIWRSDGTVGGTKRFSNFVQGPGGVNLVSYFSLSDGLYVAAQYHHNRLEFFKINTSFNGFADDEYDHEDREWDRYLLRHGPSHDDWMSPLSEPRLYKTANGYAGMLQGFRTNLNYFDKWLDVSGTFEMRFPHLPSGKNGNILYWLNENGLVERSIYIMAQTDKTDIVHLPDSDEYILTFEHKDGTSIGDFYLEKPGLYSGLARLDANGDVIWYQLFNESGAMRVVDIKSDEGHVYLTGTYANPSADFGEGVTLHTEYNQQFFVASFDLNGRAVWATNTPMEGLNRFSTLGQLAVDGENGKLYTVYSEHTLGTMNTCSFGDWAVRINALSLDDGSPVWMKDFVGDDMIRVRDVATDKLGQLWMVGNFRGEMSVGQNSFTAAGEGSCPHNAFTLVLAGSEGGFQHFHSTDEIHRRGRKLMPMDDYMDAMYINAFWDPDDVLPPLKHRRVSYIEKSRFTLTGRLLETERFPTTRGVYFGGYSNDEDAQIKATMCNSGDGHYVIKLANYRHGLLGLGNRQAAPYMFGKAATTLIKRKHPEVSLPDEVIDEMVGSDFLLVPNPTDERAFKLVINPGKFDGFDKMKVYDIQGKLILNRVLDKEYYSRLYHLPSHLKAGVYVVTLEGTNERQSQRLVIL